ncbi:hypothetical protein KEM48_009743 [Puccinia striiformis f. sp. tritici PST-130]|nr:hypothetical protein KEM48_009743 [Puccinia striiformis f. sp. tritici PST-130]
MAQYFRRLFSMANSQQQPASRHRFPTPNSIQRLKISGPEHPKLTQEIRDQFKQSVPLLAARIPSPLITQFKAHPELKKVLLNSKNLRSVEPDPDSTDHSFKLLLLNTSNKDEIPGSTIDILNEHDIQIKNTSLELIGLLDGRLLPDQLIDIPASFTIIGHIAHFNLRDDFLPYKYLIGQVILEKNLAIKTVVNKIDNINSTFRFFEMEL